MTATPGEDLVLKDVPWSDPFETIKKGSRLLSARVGLLKDIGTGVYYPGDPLAFVFGNQGTDTSRLRQDIKTFRDRSGGAGTSLERGMAAAIGEVAERYCVRFYDSSQFVFGSYDSLRHKYAMVEPRLARLHTKEQILEKGGDKSPGGYGRVDVFDDSSDLNWVWGYSLSEHKWKLVPAHLVYLPYKASEGEIRAGWNSSTGLAAGNTIEEAILSAIYEWIERDSFILCWLNRFVPRTIDVDTPDQARMLDQRFNAGHPDVHLTVFDTTLDIQIPSAFVWMIRPMEFGQVCFVGAAARLSPVGAFEKAMVELAQCVPYCRYNLKRMADWQPAPDYSNVRSFEEHSVMYLKRFDLVESAFTFCRGVDRTVKLSEIPDNSTGKALGEIDTCVREIGRHGHEVLVVEVTTPDVAEVGLRAVRVVIPGLGNLHGNHNWPCLAVERLYDVPKKLDWQRHGWREDAPLNPFPHPFP
jgi:ribosomal protein S12 methylthiotransferase accessory factor